MATHLSLAPHNVFNSFALDPSWQHSHCHAFIAHARKLINSSALNVIELLEVWLFYRLRLDKFGTEEAQKAPIVVEDKNFCLLGKSEEIL